MKGTSPTRSGFWPARHRSAKIEVSCLQSDNERGSHGEDYYCGYRSGKERVLAARGGRCRARGAAAHGAARSTVGGRGWIIAVSDRHGGVLGGARVGPAVPGVGAHGAAGGAQVCGSVQEERQERRQRCRGDL